MNGEPNDSAPSARAVRQETKLDAGNAAVAAPESGDEAEKEWGGRSEKRKDERHEQEMLSSAQARRFRWWVFVPAIAFSIVPPVLLALLVWMPPFSAHPVPMTAFITGAFVSFIAVFGFLIRGAFGYAREKERREDSATAGGLTRAVRGLLENLSEYFSRKAR